MNWLDRAIGAVAPGAALRRLRQRQALGADAAGLRGSQGRTAHRWLGDSRQWGQCRDRAGTFEAARAIARSGAQQSLRHQGGECAGQQSGRHRDRSAGQGQAKCGCEGGRSAVAGVCGKLRCRWADRLRRACRRSSCAAWRRAARCWSGSGTAGWKMACRFPCSCRCWSPITSTA